MEILSRESRIYQGPPTQEAYENLVNELATIRMNKVLSYGEDRYKDPDIEHQTTITYADIYRKFIRIKELCSKGVFQLNAADGESLRDTFMDLANYCLMGVQQLDAMPQPAPKADLMQIDQVAIYSEDPEGTKALLDLIFGSDTWHTDHVVASGQVFDQDGQNKAELNFNYQLIKNGVEFEVLKYEEGPNWVAENSQTYGVCHLGVHVDDVETISQSLLDMGFKVAQEVRTESHTTR